MPEDTEADSFPIHVYANAVELTSGPFDIALDFGFKSPEDMKRGSPEYQKLVRVSMSTSHAKSMLKLLVEQIAAYEERFGIVPSPHFDRDEGD